VRRWRIRANIIRARAVRGGRSASRVFELSDQKVICESGGESAVRLELAPGTRVHCVDAYTTQSPLVGLACRHASWEE